MDYGDSFSTTISGSGVCLFYSLATMCNRPVHGGDAVCGHVQAKEQNNLYAFIPSHHEYTASEYEELAILRENLQRLLVEEGEEWLNKAGYGGLI